MKTKERLKNSATSLVLNAEEEGVQKPSNAAASRRHGNRFSPRLQTGTDVPFQKGNLMWKQITLRYLKKRHLST